MNKERLLLAADLLAEWRDNLARKQDGEIDLGTVPHHKQSVWWCGTGCCAWGYLACCPEIKKMGVKIIVNDSKQGRVYYGGAEGYSGITLFFEMDLRYDNDLVYDIFGPDKGSLWNIESRLRRLAHE